MNIAHLIRHPEELNSDTLHELRSVVATHPYFHTARLLYLNNLFLLQDPSFDKELKRAAAHLPNRQILFSLLYGEQYALSQAAAIPVPESIPHTDRTASLIDNFLNHTTSTESKRSRTTVADPSSDYMSYLFQTQRPRFQQPSTSTAETPSSPAQRTATLIDTYMEQQSGRLAFKPQLDDTPNSQQAESPPPIEDSEEATPDETYFTETLAKIYIQQERYERAIEIITRLHLNNRKKSAYFADQIRFLQKLAINNKYKQ